MNNPSTMMRITKALSVFIVIFVSASQSFIDRNGSNSVAFHVNSLPSFISALEIRIEN